ncbi:hypothetical protein GKZ89_11795 [Bacillus mangrovi]|uniref:Uncharacterized protein n=1 Tax=Metabacillus mangrovi TaxID=1491830 RepID=A0A7X2S5P2_9BACI|nr:hypothetical protein [Metabacillus mangrovi]MTH54092.1 hypothetical protein [Metabacillus mangrovi]
MNNNSGTKDEINDFFKNHAEYWSIVDIKIDYMKESIRLKLVSTSNQELLKTSIQFNQVLSYYVHQEPVYEGFRLNSFGDNDYLLLSEISYHPEGFGQIFIKSLDSELKEIESLTAPTNFFFQVNNKDCFFIEANSLIINGKQYRNLLKDETILKKPY